MSEDLFERIKRGLNGKAEDEADWEQHKRAADGTRLPALTLQVKSHRTWLSAPEVESRGRDRRSKREANEEQRKLDKIVSLARIYGLTQDASCAVGIHGVESIDLAQEEMVGIFYSRKRLDVMNDYMASYISESIQQLGAYTHAVSELHHKRQMENL